MKKIAAFLLLLLSIPAAMAQEQTDIKPLMKKFGELMLYLQHHYVDSLDLEEITEKMMVSGVEQLDPHSLYIPADKVAEMDAPLQGGFGGVGIHFVVISDTLVVQSVVENGPSDRAGICPGDRILQIDGDTVTGTGISLETVRKRLRGDTGTSVCLSIHRRGYGDKVCMVKRDLIPMYSLDAAYEAAPGILYLRLGRFARYTYDEFLEACSDYKGKKKGMILDLRGNSGGYMHIALKLASQFLDKGSLVLYTEGNSSPRHSETAKGYGAYRRIPLVILVDEASASASEILSGAVQDWDRGLIIGRRTFGKGLVQQQLKFSDGSRLRLTVARYHTPSGRVVQTPYTRGDARAYHEDFARRFTSGEMFSADSMQINDSSVYRTLKLGRIVHGGGGIVPDLFVAADTSLSSPFCRLLFKEHLLVDFSHRYIDAHREELRTIKTFDDFNRRYDRELKVFDLFLKEIAGREDLDASQESAEVMRRLNLLLKAYMTRTLYGDDRFYYLLNQEDPVYRKAVEIFSDPGILPEDLKPVFNYLPS